MKIRYPQMGIALAVAALLAGTCAVSAYAVPETDAAGTSTAASDTTAANESDDTLWKAEISDYDSSLSLVQYEEVKPSEEQAARFRMRQHPENPQLWHLPMRQAAQTSAQQPLWLHP